MMKNDISGSLWLSKVYGSLRLNDDAIVMDVTKKPTRLIKIRAVIIKWLTMGAIRWEWFNNDN